jgi:putative transposase
MSQNFYSEILLHYVWHTKASMALLTPRIETAVHAYLKQRLINTPGVFVHEIGGTEDHVHVVVSIVPTVTPSELVGQMTGSSSHEINQRFGRKALAWQAGYSVVSFGTKDLEWVRAYVRNQKEHHARGTAQPRLEQITSEDDPAQAEHREAP